MMLRGGGGTGLRPWHAHACAKGLCDIGFVRLSVCQFVSPVKNF